MQIKICGITSSNDALACAAAGVDMIGLNFCKQSPRYIRPVQARTIAQALPSSTQAVGIFVDTPVGEICRIAHDVGLRVLQLHGSESPEMCAELALGFEVLLGGLTVTGSLMAFAKLQEILPGRPLTFRFQKA